MYNSELMVMLDKLAFLYSIGDIFDELKKTWSKSENYSK